MDTGHWYFPTTFDTNTCFGFVYRIINMQTGQSYIGKKNFWSRTRKTVKGKKRKQVIVTESNWKEYTSSSNQVNEDIKKYSKAMFQFHIISLHKTKQELDFAEAKVQWQLDVTSAKLPDGTKMFYNGRVERLSYNQHTKDRIKFL